MRTKEDAMRYLLQIYSAGMIDAFEQLPADEQDAIREELRALERVFGDEGGRVLANLVGFVRDIDVAEEAAQEAFAAAAERWPRDGTPPNPGAWLTVTARNRAIDRLRRDRVLAEKTRLLEVRE